MRLSGNHGQETAATIVAKRGTDAACLFKFSGEAAGVFVTQGDGDGLDAETRTHQFNGALQTLLGQPGLGVFARLLEEVLVQGAHVDFQPGLPPTIWPGGRAPPVLDVFQSNHPGACSNSVCPFPLSKIRLSAFNFSLCVWMSRLF